MAENTLRFDNLIKVLEEYGQEAQELYKDGTPDATPTEKGGDDDAEKDKTEDDT